ncbi:hypothetical protein [Bordetella genomosp. 11]|uniref:Type 4b pilus protein PilO2 n=1 Tax=Bordetella genomosp. 11 TaxID=1416808 RepID=A0A261UJK2_9BORD|nr:hypothetical protein [Bordetella genomosp. 11]OZI62094.1 hypothetical protein CAL28_22990 [Bordetella genomosp. 11]
MAQRQNYRIVPIPGTPNALVLGMTWQTVLGQDLTVAAMRAARQARATHFTQSGPRSPAVGLLVASGRERRAKARSRLYSAAAAFAQLQRHGTQIAYAPLASGEVWIAVVVDGVVQAGGDMLLDDAQSAREKLDSLIERYGDVVVHGTDTDGTQSFSLSQLSTQTNQQSSLRRAAFRLSMVPPLWWAVLGLLLTYLAWDAGSSWWQARQARARDRLQALQNAVDAKAVWHQALANWSHTVRIDGEPGLDQILQRIAQVPLNPGRWMLVEVDCRPDAGACSTVYRRTRLADSNTLKAALPIDWKFTLHDLDTAIVQWKLPASPEKQPTTLDLGALPSERDLEKTWVPSWQALRPALQDFSLTAPTVVGVRPPNIKLPNGLEQPVERPASIALPAMRSLVINAPLRSLYGLALPPTTALVQVQVRHQPDAQPRLTTSELAVTLKGTLYVQAR